MSKYYIYKFIDLTGNIIYIGRTNDIKRRILKEHFTDLGHLDRECYQSINKIFYTEVIFESEEVAYEAILINKLKPKYNKQFNDNAVFETSIPNFEWKEFEWDFDGQLNCLKSLKKPLINFSDFFDFFGEKFLYENEIPIENIFFKRNFISNSSFVLLVSNYLYQNIYSLNIFLSLFKQNKRVLYLTLKEDPKKVWSKIVSNLCDININWLSEGCLKDNDIERLSKFLGNNISEDNLDNLVVSNLNEHNKSIDNIINFIKENVYDCVFIDDYDSIIIDEKYFYKEKLIMRKLKNLSLDIRIPIFLNYQLTPLKRIDTRPIIEDLNVSMQMFPDIIYGIHFNDHYTEEISHSDNNVSILEIITIKSLSNRGYLDNILCFEEDFCKLRDITKDEKNIIFPK